MDYDKPSFRVWGIIAGHKNPDMIKTVGVHFVYLCGLSNTVCFGIHFYRAACPVMHGG